MDFYTKIILMCKEKGVSRSKMADSIGISRSTPKDWKDGKANPNFSTLKKIADYFQVPVSCLTDESSAFPTNFITDNHDIIGQRHAPVIIINGSERSLSEQEAELLKIYKKLSVMNRAKLVVYAGDLLKEAEQK